MGYIAINNAYSTLATGLTATDTSIVVQSGHGARFNVGTDYTYATLENSSGAVEIVKVIARSGDTLTVVRGQDGTSAVTWNAGDVIDVRPCRAAFNDIMATKQNASANLDKYAAVNPTAAGLALLDDADAAAQLATLGAAPLAGATFTGLVNFAAGASIASAATINLATATGNTVVITGTTPTTSFIMNVGQQMLLLPNDAWPIIHHATNANINGGASYTCAAGDRVYVAKDSTGVVRVNVIKQDGTAVVTSSDFPAGTTMLFQQTTAPTGWTKQTTHNDKALRVVSGTASSGGTLAFTTVFGRTATDRILLQRRKFQHMLTLNRITLY